ncbi:hypothetical protein NQZ79_g4405 [Umbelopsis isabellina]|nr:hypothetical protein NQZ79_g4405 [Umbelopsis isabellina]
MSTTSTSKTDEQPRPIITYCIEYAESQNSKCAGCTRTIPNKSLRCGEISRKSKKEKKQLSKTTWYHFKCFPVPALLTKLPIEQFRGYPTIQPKDQERVQKLLKQGVGATWVEKFGSTNAKKEGDDAEGESEVKPKKKKRDDDKARDMTAELTGQNPKAMKRKNEQTARPDKSKQAKPAEVPKLPKSDMSEVAEISKAIQSSLASSKKTMALLADKKKKQQNKQD